MRNFVFICRYIVLQLAALFHGADICLLLRSIVSYIKIEAPISTYHESGEIKIFA